MNMGSESMRASLSAAAPMAIFILSSVVLPVGPAQAGAVDVVSIDKQETITIPGVTTGSAQVAAKAGPKGMVKPATPTVVTFPASLTGISLKQIIAGPVSVGGYSAQATANVGQFMANGDGTFTATANLTATTQTPSPPPVGGYAGATSKVAIKGTIAYKQAVNQLLKVAKTLKDIGTFKETAAKGGAVVEDPLSITMTDTNTGETISSEIYSDKSKSEEDGTVGFNSSGNLELTIDDDSTGELASYQSTTDVSYATNLTGSASLENGVLSISGLFGNLADWTLTTDGSYIYDAVFNDSSILDEIDVSLPQFSNPATSPTDIVSLEVDTALKVLEFDVPEPSSLALFAAGLLGLFGVRQRFRSV